MFPVQTTSTRTRRGWQSPHLRRAAWLLVVGAVVLLLAGAAWLAVSAWSVAGAVGRAQTEVALARQAYQDRDLPAGARHVTAAQDELHTARRAATAPVWQVAGTLPVVGDDIRAVAAVAGSAAGVMDAVEPLAGLAARADAGHEPMVRTLLLDESLPGQLARAHERTSEATVLSEELSTWQLHPAVAERVQAYGQLVGQVEEPLGTAATYGGFLPGLLGAEQPQDLLVVVQTPAEVRSLGGLAGLTLVVRADAGQLSVVETYSSSTVPVAAEPVLSTPQLQEHYALFGDRAGRYMANATMVPDAALASQLLAEAHRRHTGRDVDAVVLTDLALLTGLLSATGPVDLPGGRQLTSDTSDDLLQHGVYVQIPDPAAQDVFFAAAAAAVFQELTAPAADPVALGRTLASAAEAGRLTLWSPDEETQRLVDGTALADDPLADPGVVGVFLNDATGAKMQYFLDGTVSTGRRDDGGSTVVVELTSTVADPASLPDYVAGGHARHGLPRGGQRVQVAVYGPEGSGPIAWRVDGDDVMFSGGPVGSRQAGVRSVDLAPGQRVRIEVDLSAEPADGGYEFATTPVLRHETGSVPPNG